MLISFTLAIEDNQLTSQIYSTLQQSLYAQGLTPAVRCNISGGLQSDSSSTGEQ